MSVWLTIPSARPLAAVDGLFHKWRARGYKIALWRDPNTDLPAHASHAIMEPYPGYCKAVNQLIREVMELDPEAEWFIAAGDDTEPDAAHYSEEIARQCREHFAGSTFGVMQPTGDRWHEGVGGFTNAPIDRVAGSAWYGREYCRRMYGGCGPLHEGYEHMYEDEEAQLVAEKMGVYWQRRDLVHFHRHWGRGATDGERIELKPGTIPPHLVKWNTAEHWQKAKALFESRRAAGFPGYEPIE